LPPPPTPAIKNKRGRPVTPSPTGTSSTSAFKGKRKSGKGVTGKRAGKKARPTPIASTEQGTPQQGTPQQTPSSPPPVIPTPQQQSPFKQLYHGWNEGWKHAAETAAIVGTRVRKVVGSLSEKALELTSAISREREAELVLEEEQRLLDAESDRIFALIEKSIGSLEKATFKTIHYLAFVTLHASHPSEWEGRNGTIAQVRKRMKSEKTNPPSWRSVRRVLHIAWAAATYEQDYDLGRRIEGGGRKTKLTEDQLTDVARLVNKGYPSHMVAARMNEEAREQGVSFKVCGDTITNSVMRIPDASRARVTKIGQGSFDKHGKWARSSKYEAREFGLRVECGLHFLNRSDWIRSKVNAVKLNNEGKDDPDLEWRKYDDYPPI
jgi:hypothetical protein